MTKSINVAILGIGNIGGEVARRIASGTGSTASSGVKLNLVAAMDRGAEQAEAAGIDASLVSADGPAIVDRDDVDIVVETLGGAQPAADLMIRALAQGKHVVTANKEAAAKNLPSILAAARDGDAAFMFEASIGGGIPLVVSLRQILANNNVSEVRGILNGTTNYILHRMETEGCDYRTALQGAQELGYAEPDPTADVEGLDAANKIALLGSMISGSYVHPDDVDTTGISGVTLGDFEEAREKDGTLRLIAGAVVGTDGEVNLKVAPTFVSNADLFSRVVRNYNAIEIVGDRVGPVWLHGQGAGPDPTASAILSDVIEAAMVGSAASPKLAL
ncbi:MAG: homoserine dehydrogenase [Thermomicrobiales bacterium]